MGRQTSKQRRDSKRRGKEHVTLSNAIKVLKSAPVVDGRATVAGVEMSLAERDRLIAEFKRQGQALVTEELEANPETFVQRLVRKYLDANRLQ